MTKIEITKGAMAGNVYELAKYDSRYTAKNGKEYFNFNYSGDGRIIRKIETKNARIVED